MKTKDVIISTAAIMVGVAVTIGAGVAIKNQIDKNQAYNSAAKSIVCKYDPTLNDKPLDKIIVGILPVPDDGVNSRLSVFAVPPTLNEVQAYLSACALFENVNPAGERGLRAFTPVYASGKISDSSIFASDNIDINSGDQYFGKTCFSFWEKDRSHIVAKDLIVKKSKVDVLKKYINIEDYLKEETGMQPSIILYELLIKKDDVILGNNVEIMHSIRQPINIFEIYGTSDLSKIYTDAYNPLKRVRLVSNNKN
ncbi:MAG: hypothetical protein IJI84_00880 [Clostridia bacterium]|nr:hypothetical protein [Clostridia bacterium]